MRFIYYFILKNKIKWGKILHNNFKFISLPFWSLNRFCIQALIREELLPNSFVTDSRSPSPHDLRNSTSFLAVIANLTKQIEILLIHMIPCILETELRIFSDP